MTEETGSLRSTRVSLPSSGRQGNRQQQHRQAVQQAGHAQVLLKSPAINRLLSAWFTILSAFAEPQTSKSAFALFVAARILFSVTFWNSLPKSHPRRNCLGWAHWASHSNKSRDVGCWPTLRTSLSLQPKILGKHYAAHSPTGLHEWNNFSPKLELPLSIQLRNWASIDQLSFFEELGPDGVWGSQVPQLYCIVYSWVYNTQKTVKFDFDCFHSLQ